jgi:hypothetical protein
MTTAYTVQIFYKNGIKEERGFANRKNAIRFIKNEVLAIGTNTKFEELDDFQKELTINHDTYIMKIVIKEIYFH